MQSVAEKSLHLIEHYKEKPTPIVNSVKHYMEMVEHTQDLIEILINNPEKTWQNQMAYWQDAIELATNQFNHWLQGKPLPIADFRFQKDSWLHNPFFNLLSQHYVLATKHMHAMLEAFEHEDKAALKRLRFFTTRYLDALSPSNYFHSNPEVIAETLQSSGKNLLRGLDNLLSDIEKDPHHLSINMTDKKAFGIGENIAKTKGKVIYRNEMMELIQYSPQTAKTKTIPLLIIPPWINKYYILDLSSHNSFVDYAVKQGITVFMISWVNPNEAHAKKGFYHYLKEGPQAALEVIQKQLSVKQVNALGFCIGGTLLATLLAYHKARKIKAIKSATFLTTMIDFSDPGDISVFIDEKQIKQLEEEMSEKGYLPGKVMANSFNSLKANELIWSFFIKNYMLGQEPAPFDILYWNSDSTNLPYTMHSQYLRWMYLHNNLIKPGKIKLNGCSIDVSKIDTPSFFLSTEKDHIAPWKTTYKGYEILKGPKCFVLGGSGHIAGVINPSTSSKYGYKTHDGLGLSPEAWLDKAKEHSGSWWPYWLKWLRQHSGKMVKAPEFGQLPIKPLMDAPGEYVLVSHSK